MTQFNFVTKQPFSKEDSTILEIVGEAREYKSNRWMTYSQMRRVGRLPRAGQKGTILSKTVIIKEKYKKPKYRRTKYAVFNEEQTNVTRK